MKALSKMIRALVGDLTTALGFLTRLPISPNDHAQLASAARCFPLVGALVGLVAGAVGAFAYWIGLGAWLAAVFAVTTQIAVTGALHEDGLADVADGFGGGFDRATKLAIMRDSAVGSYAVLALVLVLAARIAAVAALAPGYWLLIALPAATAASRGAITVSMHMLPPARDDGLGASAGTPTRLAVGQSLLFCVLCVVPLGPVGAAAALVGATLGGCAVAWLALRQIGGATGDVFGAIQVIAEVAALCAIVLVCRA